MFESEPVVCTQQPWPRTATEKLLVSVCQGSAAQALGILEALSDSNRRTLVSAAPVPLDMGDAEIPDVYMELFLAAQEIMLGKIVTLKLKLKLRLFMVASQSLYWRHSFFDTTVPQKQFKVHSVPTDCADQIN